MKYYILQFAAVKLDHLPASRWSTSSSSCLGLQQYYSTCYTSFLPFIWHRQKGAITHTFIKYHIDTHSRRMKRNICIYNTIPIYNALIIDIQQVEMAVKKLDHFTEPTMKRQTNKQHSYR